MITLLTGKVLEKNPPYLVVDVNGVGYEVAVPMTCFYQLPDVKEPVTIHTHFVVREDAQLLYGFTSTRKRHVFRELLKVNGIGAKIALAILSGMESDHLVGCVMNEDVTRLSKIPGIGKKTAERIVVEMRDRLKDWSDQVGAAANLTQAPVAANTSSYGSARQDAADALVALGYKTAEAEKTIARLGEQIADLSSDQIIKLSLQQMVG